MLTRRRLLTGLGAALAAPAVVRAEILMPVRSLWTPPVPLGAVSHWYTADSLSLTERGAWILANHWIRRLKIEMMKPHQKEKNTA